MARKNIGSVLCPFFRSLDKEKPTIRCERLRKGYPLRVECETDDELNRFLACVCSEKFTECANWKILMKKYEDRKGVIDDGTELQSFFSGRKFSERP